MPSSPSTPIPSAQWAEQNGVEGDYATISQDPRTQAFVQGSVDELNATLNRWETIKQFRILDREFAIESGELTPSLKIKRKVVESMYSDVLDSMYTS